MGFRCFLIGHRETGKEIKTALQSELRRHVEEYGVTEFVVGHYGGFDFLVRQAVAEMKSEYPQITLTLLLPYHPQERPVALPPGVDGTVYPAGLEKAPPHVAIVRANRSMVDASDFLVACVWHPASAARNILEYALRRENRGLIRVTVLPQVQRTLSKP